MLFNLLRVVTLSIQILSDTVDKLPNHNIIEEHKETLKKQVSDTLKGLQEVIDGEKEIRSRYNDIYG